MDPTRLHLSLVRDEGYLASRHAWPVNLLRNIASDGCPASTDAVLLLDANFELCVTWRKRLATDTSAPNPPSAGPRQLNHSESLPPLAGVAAHQKRSQTH